MRVHGHSAAGPSERWLRGREDRDVAADAAAAAENTRSPRLWSPRPRPSDPKDQEAGRGGGAASAAWLCGQIAVGTRWRRPAVPLPAGAGTAARGLKDAGALLPEEGVLVPALEATRSLGTTLGAILPPLGCLSLGRLLSLDQLCLPLPATGGGGPLGDRCLCP